MEDSTTDLPLVLFSCELPQQSMLSGHATDLLTFTTIHRGTHTRHLSLCLGTLLGTQQPDARDRHWSHCWGHPNLRPPWHPTDTCPSVGSNGRLEKIPHVLQKNCERTRTVEIVTTKTGKLQEGQVGRKGRQTKGESEHAHVRNHRECYRHLSAVYATAEERDDDTESRSHVNSIQTNTD